MGETGELYPGSGGTGWCCLPPKEDPHPQLLRPYLTSLSDGCWCLCVRYVDTYIHAYQCLSELLSAIHCMWSECAVIRHLSQWAVVSLMSEWAPVSQCLYEVLSAVCWVCCRQPMSVWAAVSNMSYWVIFSNCDPSHPQIVITLATLLWTDFCIN